MPPHHHMPQDMPPHTAVSRMPSYAAACSRIPLHAAIGVTWHGIAWRMAHGAWRRIAHVGHACTSWLLLERSNVCSAGAAVGPAAGTPGVGTVHSEATGPVTYGTSRNLHAFNLNLSARQSQRLTRHRHSHTVTEHISYQLITD